MCPIQFESPWYASAFLTIMCTLKQRWKKMTIKHFLVSDHSRYKMYQINISISGLHHMLHSDTLKLAHPN
jgi:hypothetical protein